MLQLWDSTINPQIAQYFIPFKRNMLSMYPDVSAGTAGEILGGKEKIEIPHSGELEPGSDPLPGLTSEAHWGVKSPLREAGEERSPEPPGEHSSDVQKTFSLPPESQALVSGPLPPGACVRNGSWWRAGLPPESRQRAPGLPPAGSAEAYRQSSVAFHLSLSNGPPTRSSCLACHRKHMCSTAAGGARAYRLRAASELHG